MSIRQMEIADIPAVLSLQEELQFQEWNEKQFSSEIRAGYAHCVVYESEENNIDGSHDNPKILGYAVFHLLGPDSELLSIATTPSQQRKGIGLQLLRSGLDSLDFSAGDCCFLEVRDSNFKARQFYEKNGFKFFGTRKKYYSDGEDAALYKLEGSPREN